MFFWNNSDVWPGEIKRGEKRKHGSAECCARRARRAYRLLEQQGDDERESLECQQDGEHAQELQRSHLELHLHSDWVLSKRVMRSGQEAKEEQERSEK